MTPATGRPQRRRKSSLAEEHPAWHPRAAVPEDPRPETVGTEAETRPGGDTAAHPTTDEEYGDETVPGGEDPSARPRTPTPRRDARADAHAEARARQTTRNAAWSWAAAARKADQRRNEWAEEMAHARSLGTLPAILRGYITEAADQAGIPEHDIPSEVWNAAGLTRP